MANYRKKKVSVGTIIGRIFLGLGITIIVGLVIGAITYGVNPDFRVAVNNGWQEIVNFFQGLGKKAEPEAVTSGFKMFIK